MAILNEKSLIVGQVNVLITYIYTSIGMFVVRDLNFFSKLQSLSMNATTQISQIVLGKNTCILRKITCIGSKLINNILRSETNVQIAD